MPCGATLGGSEVRFGFIALLGGALIGLLGAFMIMYEGEVGSEGDTYVNLGGRRIDADIVGVPVLLFGLGIVTVSLLALRRS